MTTDTRTARRPSPASAYLRLARPDHWVKHVFILPGIALALLLAPHDAAPLVWSIAAGLASAALAASANYALNEWLDGASDRHHPVKSNRPTVRGEVTRRGVVTLYLLTAGGALALGSIPSRLFLWGVVALLVSGWAYNIPPIRTKDVALLDVLTEAINNPIRLLLGWAMVSATTLPPASLVLGYWMTGAFLMTIKRTAEYRTLERSVGVEAAAAYRRSFAWYSDSRLIVVAVLFAQLAAFFVAVFLVKYRIEYLVSLPVFAAWFAAYFRVGLKPDSTAQTPELLFREPLLMGLSGALVISLLLLTWVDLPWLEALAAPHFIRISPTS